MKKLDQKRVVTVSFKTSQESKLFDESLKKLEKLKKEKKKIEADISQLETTLKNQGIKEFIQICTKEKEVPESFLIKSDISNSNYLFTVNDQYKKIDEDQAKKLKLDYGSLIEETKLAIIDPAFFKKYQKVIKKFIDQTDLIKEDDKEDSIIETIDYSVSKGSIFTITKYKDKQRFFDDLQPVVKIPTINS